MRRATSLVVALALWPRGAPAAITKGPWVQRVSADSAIVRVEVDPPAPVSVDLDGGQTSDGGRRVIQVPEARALHAITLQGLSAATRYSYSVRAGASSRLAAFVTAPRDDADAAFRFLIYGDNRTDDAAHAAVVRAMAADASEFVVHTGDFVENGASPAQWQTFFEIEAPLLSARCLFSCVGNHELTDGAGIEYARFFGPTDVASDAKPDASAGPRYATRPEHLNGTFRWGNARFFLLNAMVSMNGTLDRAWLEKSLADADAEAGVRWRIAVMHHGPWSSGPHGGNARLHDAGLPALFKAHKIDLVVSGHDHIYERGWAEGLAYVVSGGGGAPVYRLKSQLAEARKLEAARHFVEVNVSPTALRLVATRSDNSVIERCGLNKSSGWDCDGVAPSTESAPSVPPPANASPAGPVGAPAPTSRCSCDAVGARRAGDGGAGVAILGAVAAFVRARARRGRATRGAGVDG